MLWTRSKSDLRVCAREESQEAICTILLGKIVNLNNDRGRIQAERFFVDFFYDLSFRKFFANSPICPRATSRASS